MASLQRHGLGPNPQQLEHLDDELPLLLEQVGVGVVGPDEDERPDLKPLPPRHHVHDACQLKGKG